MSESKYENLVVDSLLFNPPMSPDFQAIYDKFATRIRWIDGNLVPGAFQMNTAWYTATPEKDPIFEQHQHDTAEIVGFFGSDPDNPDELGAYIEALIGDEVHPITKSAYVFLPPQVPHGFRILDVHKPVFHFSVVTESAYNGGAYK